MNKLSKLGTVAFTVLLMGCTDLSTVSQFAATGAKATSSSDVLSGGPDAEKAAVRLAFPPTDQPKKDETARREAAENDLKITQQTSPFDVAGLKALALYFSVISDLSSDKLIDVKSSASSISNSLSKAPFDLVPTAKVSAVGGLLQLLLEAPLDAYRNQEVGKLIVQANSNIMTLCADLSASSLAISQIWESDIHSTEEYYGGIRGRPEDIRGAILMKSLASQEEVTFRANEAKAKALSSALDSVCSGQKQLFDNHNNLQLATLKSLLNGYTADINIALTLLGK